MIANSTRRTTGAMSAFAAVLLAACAPAAPVTDVAADEATIRQLSADFAAAEATNNIDSVMTFLWEDAVMQPPNAPQIQGHEAIRGLYGMVTFLSMTPGDISAVVSGDLAATWGSLSVAIQGPEGPITDEAKFVAVWQRRNGIWKVLENTWNSSLPMPVN